MTRNWRDTLLILPSVLVFLFLVSQLWFVQDDAYITYRYVANYLNGDGLVFNVGERVEGFTNFGWTLYLCLAGAIGLDYILVSQITGLLFGVGIIILTLLIGRLLFADSRSRLALLPPYLVGFNMSLAYWSPAGLETAAFAFFSMLAVFWFLKRSHWLVFALLMAVWIRPEGALVALLLLIMEAVTERGLPRYSFIYGAVAFVLSLPFVIFKMAYYGSIFPNPLFAKTGFGIEQLASGLEYVGRFLGHYGFWGLGLLIPLLFFKRLSGRTKSIWVFVVLYLVYIVLIGGDVLKVHRFFLPLFGFSAILLILSVSFLLRGKSKRTVNTVVILVTLPIIVLTYLLPADFVKSYNVREKLFTQKMARMADEIKGSDSTDFSVALPTIGIFGYKLLGHRIIDMVGLTDSTIARHPMEPIPGLETTWKERNYNTEYILETAPDYILFSTGMKPSAPAERALVLCPAFQQSYRSVSWYFRADTLRSSGQLHPAFKKVRPITAAVTPTYPVEFVQSYKSGMDAFAAGDYRTAIKWFNAAIKVSPEPQYVDLLHAKGYSHLQLGQYDDAVALMEYVLQQDSLVVEAHGVLYLWYTIAEDSSRMAIHRRWIRELVPWYWPRVDSMTQATALKYRRAAGR